jgi:hypothetical protein
MRDHQSRPEVLNRLHRQCPNPIIETDSKATTTLIVQ